MTLDPRWEWAEIVDATGKVIRVDKTACNHLEVVPVDDSDGETVAHLCMTCDSQLPAEWRP